jgi:Ran GTPase-activating protein (RanGAP) involved in mRNA processing and transport
MNKGQSLFKNITKNHKNNDKNTSFTTIESSYYIKDQLTTTTTSSSSSNSTVSLSSLSSINNNNNIITNHNSSSSSSSSRSSSTSIDMKLDNCRQYVIDNSIDISNKNMTAKDLIILKEYFKDHFRPNTTTSSSPSSSSLSSSSSSSLSNNHIEILRLGYNSFKDEGVKFFTETLLSSNNDSSSSSSSSSNGSSSCCCIKSIDLSFNDITDIGAESIAKYLSQSKHIQVLFLSGNSISSKGFQYIANSLRINQSLIELDLTGNAGRNKGIIALAEALDNNNNMKSITLSGCKIQNDGIQRLCKTLDINHNIISINISNNNLGDNGANEISKAMLNNKMIESLNISLNNITHIGMRYLGNSLINYKSLKRLGLDNNKLRDKGSIYFSKIYLTMDLKDLNIGFNEIGVDGIIPLLQAIASHMTLNVLSLSGNNIDYNAATILSSLLSSNKTLNTLQLYHTGLSEASQRRIAVGIASNKEGVFTTLSGFDLAQSAHILGPLKLLENQSNKVILKCFNETWKAKALSQQLLQNDMKNSLSNSSAHHSIDSIKIMGDNDLLNCVDGLAEELLQDDDMTELFTNLKTTRKEKSEQVQEAVQELLLSCNESIENALQMISVESVQDITKFVEPSYELSAADSNLLFRSIIEASKDTLAMPFNSKELWELQQYYMSPKIDVLKDYQDEILDAEDVHEKQQIDNNDKKIRRLSVECDIPLGECTDYLAVNPFTPVDVIPTQSKATSKLTEELTTRTRKRSQGPIKIRLAYYPKIKELYETQKLEGNELSMLHILRFLKFLETLPPPYQCKSETNLEILFFEGQGQLFV